MKKEKRNAVLSTHAENAVDSGAAVTDAVVSWLDVSAAEVLYSVTADVDSAAEVVL